ncbi:Molybdenum-pterin-binding protein MopA [Fundidesulfovibrio magnetotacticus]|uniref:Molybdenum-pterin-binding protein MopA n=1 Tax=Fundidesulfovibrio magnetotacticus TaxID=2730080 RepID=A0A6V8LIY3_9BACT|nr:LysR family transcriptional regulator [Fundidesulfovibrio magnetotacticus]GFK92683.1 Molybdenum-pterin-binding protein MopA [Fundidesulfovibrio magnetotacticus]
MKDPNVSSGEPAAQPSSQSGLADVRPPVVRLRLWLETGDGMFFGSGRGMLLEAVARTGSLKKAAESLGMSYRAAWGKMRRTEKVLGVQLIEQAGSRKGGHRLTPAGRLLMEKFGQWFDAVENSAVEKAREIFPWACLSFAEARRAGFAPAPREDDESEGDPES